MSEDAEKEQKPAVRTGQGSTKLTRAEFEQRWNARLRGMHMRMRAKVRARARPVPLSPIPNMSCRSNGSKHVRKFKKREIDNDLRTRVHASC